MILKLIPGCTNYYAGDDGNIYSNFNEFKKLKPNIQTSGKYYCLSVVINEIRVTKRVHTLVNLAFNGNPPNPKFSTSHLDGNWKNNKPENLTWESVRDNLNRKKQHGTDDIGIKNSRAKIDLETLKEIRKYLAEGKLNHREIGELFGLNRVFITKIKNGMRYSGQGF